MSKILKWLVVILIFSIGSYMLAEWKMKHEIISFLERKVPDHINFSYDELAINLLEGNIAFTDVAVVSLGKQTSSCEIRVNANELSIEGFSYWKILFQKSVHIKTLTLSTPHLHFKTCPKDPNNVVANKSNPINLLKEIFVEELKFESGVVEIWDANEEVELISVASLGLHLKDVATDPETITKYVPFTFSNYQIEIAQFKAPLGEYENLQMASLVMNNSSIDMTDISLLTKYSKAELSKQITYERDHVSLTIPAISINDHNYVANKDSLQINFKEVKLIEPNLEIYRDKSPLEDFSTKPLYGTLLRRLPFKIAIDAILIQQGTIVYKEDAPNNVKAGALRFTNLNADINNLSNLTTVNNTVNIKLNAHLMDAGALHLDWNFNVNDPHDSFLISGKLSNFYTEKLNDFLVPNLRTQTTGTIEQLYFTISGDEYTSSGDIKMRYEDFKFQLLNKERNGVKKVLSFIGNLFVNDGSKADENGFRYGTISVERTQHKSFFNYLWINLQDGLVDVLTSNGKKE
ncbi:hypothetical protein SAMN05192540_1061 [Maribacter dokdonensis]|uniref:DUF748 domain-containing protein n=1 Tax=Maribacter dokdonensis TaxID=320912 RepID=A0A1H4KSK7_9FLAO|nr:hypothetical protein [Maribacter dokdonensis]SEB61373.1 hypothetical protein SAMN05192540_1061 [Maribacter dokdonensis]